MNLEQKLKILNRIYAIYDEFATGIDTACRMYCCRCCTRNVIITTLEAYKIITTVALENKGSWIRLLERSSRQARFQPKTTTNKIAELCVRGKDLPDEESDVDGGKCPLLDEKLCSIYGIRAFGCRCFISNTNCNQSGNAIVDEHVLTVNNIFLQTIEHVDSSGCSGNLTDVLLCLVSREARAAYRNNQLRCAKSGLIKNYPMPTLMIPPAQREKVKPIVEKLQRIRLKI